jgi:hypothetical protein
LHLGGQMHILTGSQIYELYEHFNKTAKSHRQFDDSFYFDFYGYIANKNFTEEQQKEAYSLAKCYLLSTEEGTRRLNSLPNFAHREFLKPRIYNNNSTNIWWFNRGSSSKSKSDHDSLAAILVALIFLIATPIAMYYLIIELGYQFERFIYNEGIFQGAVNILAITAITVVSAWFIQQFASSHLAVFALKIGFANPAGAAVFLGFCLTIISAALATWAFNATFNLYLYSANSDSIDRNDPYRYDLTASEESKLEKKGFNTLMVKMAISALRSEMGTDEHPLHNIFASRTSQVESNLELIRKIRRGQVENVPVGKVDFNLYLKVNEPVPTSAPSHSGRPQDPQAAREPASYEEQELLSRQPYYVPPAAHPIITTIDQVNLNDIVMGSVVEEPSTRRHCVA